MIEVRLHGRGGQGCVTAAEVLAMAAFFDGKKSQAFPYFGVERTGAPVQAYCRIDDEKIKLHQQVYEPDYIVILDNSLLDVADVFSGLKKGGIAVIASKEPIQHAGTKVMTVDAYEIAQKHVGRPIVNIAVLGAFAKATGLVSLEALEKAVLQVFEEKPGIGEKNFAALKECFEATK